MTPINGAKTSVELAIPVYNEQEQLEVNVLKIRQIISKPDFHKFSIKLTIVDNASTDATPQIAKSLINRYPDLSYLRLEKKGRGRALRECWTQSQAEILAYMDVDLSADLNYLFPLLEKISQNKLDLVIGSRLKQGARVRGRTFVREIMSRGYNLLVRLVFHTGFQDAQCGFKAIRNQAFRTLEPKIIDNHWFFDTELLILAEKSGLTVEEIPISWVDDPGSTVKVASTALEDLKGLWRLWRNKPWKN